LHQRQVEAAKATAVAPKPGSAPTPTAAPTARSADDAPRKKHHAPHVGKRKRRY
jgi:hypothetical protein